MIRTALQITSLEELCQLSFLRKLLIRQNESKGRNILTLSANVKSGAESEIRKNNG